MAKYVMPIKGIDLNDVKLLNFRVEIDKLREDFERYKNKTRRSKWKSAKRRGR